MTADVAALWTDGRYFLQARAAAQDLGAGGGACETTSVHWRPAQLPCWECGCGGVGCVRGYEPAWFCTVLRTALSPNALLRTRPAGRGSAGPRVDADAARHAQLPRGVILRPPVRVQQGPIRLPACLPARLHACIPACLDALHAAVIGRAQGWAGVTRHCGAHRWAAPCCLLLVGRQGLQELAAHAHCLPTAAGCCRSAGGRR